MKRLRLLLLLLLLITPFVSVAPVRADDPVVIDCPTVRRVCNDIWWEGMYNLCLGTGSGTPISCGNQAAWGYAKCVQDSQCNTGD